MRVLLVSMLLLTHLMVLRMMMPIHRRAAILLLLLLLLTRRQRRRRRQSMTSKYNQSDPAAMYAAIIKRLSRRTELLVLRVLELVRVRVGKLLGLAVRAARRTARVRQAGRYG